MSKTRKLSSTPIPTPEQKPKTKKELINQIVKKKTKEKFLSESQKEYYKILKTNQITICSGPAGVGKSYIAMKCAIDLLIDQRIPTKKLLLLDQRWKLRKNSEAYLVVLRKNWTRTFFLHIIY